MIEYYYRGLSALRSALLILTLGASAACTEAAPTEHKGELEFFNALYMLPQSTMAESCVIDAQIVPMKEGNFLTTLKRIGEETNNDIMLSDPVRRNRVAYVVPGDCAEFDEEGPYSPTKYFGDVTDVVTTKAGEHPYIIKGPKDDYKNLLADLEEGAFAAQFSSARLANTKDMATDLFCILNSNLRAQSLFGLPLLHVSVRDNAILYTYNILPSDASLISFLVNRGFRECGVRYEFEVRGLNDAEINDLSNIFVELDIDK